MNIKLLTATGSIENYRLLGQPVEAPKSMPQFNRTVFSAVHVVADPLTANDPTGPAAIDWRATLDYRRHIHELGLGIAEAMDTAQRGMGLDWPGALELIAQTIHELPEATIFSGCGTDQLFPPDTNNLDDVKRAYLEQAGAIQKLGGRLIVMSSRALAQWANCPDDYLNVYGDVLASCDQPVILHWLGDMFDPALLGYWGSRDIPQAMEICLDVIEANRTKIDGIKISLLNKEYEIEMRRRLPEGVAMYTGDDFNYPELIAGDAQGYSHALLGIFDPIAPAAAKALSQLSRGDEAGFHETLAPTVPLSRQIFKSPTQFYKTGVVFLAWLNGFQSHFVMLGGAQSMRSLSHLSEVFRLADKAGLLRDPDLAIERMSRLTGLYGVT